MIVDSQSQPGILLVMAPPWGVQTPPISLGYLARYLKDKGINYGIFDLNLELFRSAPETMRYLWDCENDYIWRNTPAKEMAAQLDRFDPLVERIIASEFQQVGFSLIDPNQFIACEVIKRLKKACPQKIVITGGPVCATPEERKWLRDQTGGRIDFMIVGEGEKPLAQLLDILSSSPKTKEIRLSNVVDCRFSQTLTAPPMNPPVDLSEISFPDFTGFPMDHYTQKAAAVMWSRGCVSHCTFCKEKSLWDRHRNRPVSDILEEIRFYAQKGITEFVVYDSLINGRPRHLESLCDEILSTGIHIHWSALAIPDRTLTRERLWKMKRAGCFVLIFGLESGSDRILKKMRKRCTLKEAAETIVNTKEAGIETAVNIIVGFPGEDEADFQQTCQFLAKYHRYIDRVDAVTPLQLVNGTYLFNHPEEFQINLPQERANEFWSADGNTYDVRMARREKVVDVCRHYGIPIGKAFGSEKPNGDRLAWNIENKDHRVDILFLYPGCADVVDYETAAVIEYLKNYNLTAGYVGRSRQPAGDAEHLVDSCVVALKTTLENEEVVMTALRDLKKRKPGLKTVLWGPGCRTPDLRDRFAPGLADAFIFQEYEEAFRRCVYHMKNGSLDRLLPGIYIPGHAFVPLNPEKNLDAYPFPRYAEFGLSDRKIDSLPLKLSTGCPHRCVFCAVYQEEGPFRSRRAEPVFEAICYHFEKNHIQRYAFLDHSIVGDPENLERFCHMLTAEKWPVQWDATCIVHNKIEFKLFRHMAEAGCVCLGFGFISGSDRILDQMGKPFDTNTLRKALSESKASGLQNHVRLMVGCPGEEEHDLAQTVDFLAEMKANIDRVELIRPFDLQPGSGLQVDASRHGLLQPSHNPFRGWHDGSFNNQSYRIKKMKEMAIALHRLNLVADLPAYVDEGEEIFENRNDICRRYLDASRSEKRSWTAGVPAGRTIRNGKDPVIESIQSGSEVFAAPEILEIDLTNNCNLNCLSCWCHSPLLGEEKFRGEEKRQYLPEDKILSVLRDLEHLGGPVTIQLTGAGEPFLHPNIWRIIEAIKAAGAGCQIITNFSLLDDDDIQRLIDLQVDAITASIWAGDADTYHRNHPGAPLDLFDRISHRLSRLSEQRGPGRRPMIKIYHVINKKNADSIHSMADVALEVGADAVEFQIMEGVPGKTDVLCLDSGSRARLLSQFRSLQQRKDYTNAFIGTDHLELLENPLLRAELMEFGRLYPHLQEGFQYGRGNRTVRCPKGIESIQRSLSHKDFSVVFFFDRQVCETCERKERCWQRASEFGCLRLYPLNILGVGSFLRRLESSQDAYQAYERRIMDELPCTVGWTYCRLRVNGDVIPCCKAARFPLGNIHEASFSHIWRSRAYSVFRQKAKSLSKSDPYFSRINCYKSCDNVGMNLNAYLRLLNSRSKRGKGGQA